MIELCFYHLQRKVQTNEFQEDAKIPAVLDYFMGLIQQGFSLASAIGHSRKIVPDVRDFAVQFGQFVRDDFRKHMLYGYAQ